MGLTFSQLFPPRPSLTEANLPPQSGKVFLITGGASGIGYELARILYHAGGTVYIAGRSESNGRQSIERIKSSTPPPLASASSSSRSPGTLNFLHLDLADLSTVKPFVEAFQAQQPSLNVLFNNAGVSLPPVGSTSQQGIELQLATNCVGPYLLTQLLLPCLSVAASSAPPAATRVVWTSSQMVELAAFPEGGWDPRSPTATDQSHDYTASKVGNWFLASELASQVRDRGILSVTQNPGNLKTNLLRHAPRMMRWMSAPLLHDARMGAYTVLWAGVAEELTMENSGGYVIPWGRVHPSPKADMVKTLRRKEEGGTGGAKAFAEWCDGQVQDFKR
ncbi:MAG: hypothetical protein Q9190_003308 [Brigantiaea leucoxantha]